jgi:protein MpaA
VAGRGASPGARGLIAVVAALIGATSIAPVVMARAGEHAQARVLPSASRFSPDERRVIGRSRQDRVIVAERYGDGPVVVLVGDSIHGNERSGGRIVSAIRQAGARPGFTLWVLPRMNPDGYRAGTRQNARRVDLNRNFTTGWVRTPCPSKYCAGRSPASEPETQAFEAFFTEIQPDLAVFYHSMGNKVDDMRASSRVPSAIRAYSRTANLRLRRVSCDTDTERACSGTATQFLFANVPDVTVFVVELPVYDNVLSQVVVARHRVALWAAADRVAEVVAVPVP